MSPDDQELPPSVEEEEHGEQQTEEEISIQEVLAQQAQTDDANIEQTVATDGSTEEQTQFGTQ